MVVDPRCDPVAPPWHFLSVCGYHMFQCLWDFLHYPHYHIHLAVVTTALGFGSRSSVFQSLHLVPPFFCAWQLKHLPLYYAHHAPDFQAHSNMNYLPFWIKINKILIQPLLLINVVINLFIYPNQNITFSYSCLENSQNTYFTYFLL